MKMVLWLAAALAGAQQEAPAQVVPARGEPFHAQLVSAGEDGTLRFAAGEQTTTLAAADLVAWGNPVEPGGGPQLVTADGSLLIAAARPPVGEDVVRISDEKLVLESRVFGQVTLPLELVRGVIFQPPSDRRQRDLLADRLRSAPEGNDRLVLDNGDELTGTISNLGGDAIGLETQVGKVTIELNKVAALIFDPALVSVPKATGSKTLAGFRDGSLVTAATLAVTPEGVRLRLPGNVALQADSSEDLVSLQPLGHDRVTYLSDLTPHSYRHVPYLSLSWPFHADRNVSGGRLRAAGRLYSKGLGMHSASRITYRLDKPYRRFAAEAAIDEEAGPKGSVVFRVLTSSGSDWEQRAASEIVRGGMEPVPISVDLTGAKAITLIVDFADRGDELDHADWLNARLIE